MAGESELTALQRWWMILKLAGCECRQGVIADKMGLVQAASTWCKKVNIRPDHRENSSWFTHSSGSVAQGFKEPSAFGGRGNPNYIFAKKKLKVPSEADLKAVIYKAGELEQLRSNSANPHQGWIQYP